MNVYFINTSHRVGYTTEKPDMSVLNSKGEYIINEQTLTTPVLTLAQAQFLDKLYKVFAVENIRGDYTEIGVKYFSNPADALYYHNLVKDKKTSKMEKPYAIENYDVYTTIDTIPTRTEPILNEIGLEIQIAKRNDFRMNSELTMDQIMERYMQERSFFKNL
jgi:hypothetical protein